MALSGDLKDFGLLQLLTLVQVTSKTGALTLQRGNEIATVYFENGLLTRVKVPESRFEGLAGALYRAGRIDREQYELLGSQAPTSEKAAALLIVDQGALGQEEVVDFVREKSLAALQSLMTWPDGNFRLDVGSSPPEEDIVAPTDLTPVLERGRSYLAEWQLLVSYIPDLDGQFRLLPEPKQGQQEISLAPAEWRMVATLARELPLGETARKLGLDDFAVRQLAYRLISAGLAEVAQPEIAPTLPTEEPKLEVAQPKTSGFSRLFGQRRK